MNSGRTSTSTLTVRSPLKSLTLGQLGDVGLGRPSGRMLVLVDGLAVELVEAVAHGVIRAPRRGRRAGR